MEKPWRGQLPPPGKHWQFTPQTLDEMDARGEIYWSPTGNPRRKIYFDESEGVQVQDIWLDFRDAHNQNIEITGYPTEKNPDMLSLILQTSSNPDDLVLDCFSGSGTTLSVASQLKRRWIGIDNSVEAIATTLRRFAKGTEPMGDFVKKQTDAEKKADQEISLWVENVANGLTDNHTVTRENFIRDFALYADTSSTDDLREVLLQWLQWSGM